MKLTLGFSPCPNDTFIFDALVNHKIDTGGLSFEVILEDVQTLNEWALEGRLDVSKISYGVYPLIRNQYRLLSSGGAMGYGVGPLLISKEAPADADKLQEWVNQRSIAVPGRNTTAHFLFTHAFPKAVNKQFLVFHEIEQAVLKGETDLGVIIHENRFTYQQKGLYKVADLGTLWEQQTGLPIPLGGIVTHSRVNEQVAQQLNHLIQQSIAHAWQQYPTVSSYVKTHAQEMSEEVMRKHIELYVNDFSGDMGEAGRKAIEEMLNIYQIMQAE
jgi:1,4-dihydroxy-6-naphthoate synthase